MKSAGCHWQRSRFWLPSQTARLLLVLACACLWLLTQGTQVYFLYSLSVRQKRLSLFRFGLDALVARFISSRPQNLEFYLAPDSPTLKSVVT